MSRHQALQLAQEQGIDLIEVAPQAKPPVAKLISFSKFKYQLKQKQSQSRKKSKGQNLKEIRFTPFIAENDFNTRLKKAEEFLKEQDKVKLTVKFVGRQITRKEFGDNLLKRAQQNLSHLATVEQEPKLRGKLLSMVLAPAKKSNPKEKWHA